MHPTETQGYEMELALAKVNIIDTEMKLNRIELNLEVHSRLLLEVARMSI